MNINLRSMSDYSKRDKPDPIMDIPIWMNLLELMVNLGIVYTSYMILFGSSKKSDLAEVFGLEDESSVIIFFIFLLHVIFAIKYITQTLIVDEPPWI